MSDSSKNIVIIGGGFAGTALARRLSRRIPDGYKVVLLSRDNFITYNPLLAEVVGASIPPAHAVAPVRQIAPRAHFYMVKVTHVDFADREVHYLGEGSGTVPFEHLVICCGTRANVELVPGMADYALPLKTLGDALFLRNRVMDRLEQAELCRDPETRRWLMTFTVIGGGFSGVEVAGEITDLLRASVRYYHNVTPEDVHVSIVHSGNHLLPELPRKLGEFAARKMAADGIEVRLNTRVERIRDRGPVFRSGEPAPPVTPSGTVINTIGTSPNPLLAALGLPLERGRIAVDACLGVPGLEGVWALGDCAVVPNAADGSASPPTAQFADRQGKHLADNLLAVLAGGDPKPFGYKAVGSLSTIGHNKAVAEVMRMKFSGLLGFLMWRAVYLVKIPTLARKARLFLEWNWDLFFAQDIVFLRFARSSRAERRAGEVRRVQAQPAETPGSA